MSNDNKNPMRQNFGGQWIDDVRRFLMKNAEGCDIDQLTAKFLMEMNIFPPKAEEIIGYYYKYGFLIKEKGIYHWNKKLDIEIIPYKKVNIETEEKPKKKEKTVKEMVNPGERDKAKYKFYVKECEKAKEKPISYDEWLNELYKDKEGL